MTVWTTTHHAKWRVGQFEKEVLPLRYIPTSTHSRMPTLASICEFPVHFDALRLVFYFPDGVVNTDSNPNQSCEPDPVEDRLSAEAYLEMEDSELWEMLVNGKGIGLCNIRVAGPGEDTDLYAYSGVLNDEGDHGYPGKHAG